MLVLVLKYSLVYCEDFHTLLQLLRSKYLLKNIKDTPPSGTIQKTQ